MVVYLLKDPESGEIRYVGKTELAVEARLRSHLWPSELKKKTHKTNWLRSLVARGMKPQIQELQRLASSTELNEAERYWIKFLRSRGCPLVNGTEGGEGVIDPTGEIARRRGATARGRKCSVEARARMSASAKARLSTPAARVSTVLRIKKMRSTRLATTNLAEGE